MLLAENVIFVKLVIMDSLIAVLVIVQVLFVMLKLVIRFQKFSIANYYNHKIFEKKNFNNFSGDCICPPHVKGERCDVCEDLTYGFDQIIGCEECNCSPHGVLNGNLQCDLLNGSCRYF